MPNTFRSPLNSPKNVDNRAAQQIVDAQNPAYAATLNLVTKPKASHTTVKVAQLTGPATLNVATTNPYTGDRLQILFSADASVRTVTFGTGVAVSAATQVIAASKFGSISFMFDGTVWIETARAVTA